MFDRMELENMLHAYKQFLGSQAWIEERYKWEAVQWFQDHWDINAPDFAEMLSRSLEKTDNLLSSANNFPKNMIVSFAQSDPEAVRAMFIALFDESQDIIERMDAFKARSSVLLRQYGREAKQHYQYESALTAYLWLRFPDKYCIYKFREVKALAKALGSDASFKQGAYHENIRNFFKLYGEISRALKKDAALTALVRSQLTDACYPDLECKTLANDLGFFISRKGTKSNAAAQKHDEAVQGEKDRGYWWLNANPKFWSFANIGVGESQAYTLYNESGSKRRVFQNFLDAKRGDPVICYESYPVKQIVALGRISAPANGKELFVEKLEALTSPIDFAALRECPELEQMEYLKNARGSLFKLTKSEYDFLLDMIREENPIVSKTSAASYTKKDFLNEVYMDENRYDRLAALLGHKQNIILQGAPGVGKTFAAKRLAWSMIGEKDDSRIALIQFHQNYSYEDFVMGYKPDGDSFDLKFGVFFRFCQKAANQPDKAFFFIIDEINRGNMSKIFGELLMLIEKDYRGTMATLAYGDIPFFVPKNLYIIGMMNTADRSLAMIDYALRRRFSFFNMEPAFDSEGFLQYQNSLNSKTLNALIGKIKDLNREISLDRSLGKGFCIGHSYFCGREVCTDEWLRAVVDFDILPILGEYWFDDADKFQRWEKVLRGVVQ